MFLRRGFVAMAVAVLVGAGLAVAERPGAAMETDATPVSVVEYNLGDTAFTDLPAWEGRASEIKGRVHYPSDLSGTLPLVVVLHGQAISCMTDADVGWPCPSGVEVLPSYRGYDYLGQALARQGFAVLSVSANGINQGMGTAPQRARLINRHLALWHELSTSGGGPLAGKFTQDLTGRPASVDFRGHVDLTRVGTVGHSVGGNGVMQHASDKHSGEWPSGVQVRGVVAMATPSMFEIEEGDQLVTQASVGVISAECWGSADREFFESVRGKNKQPAYLATVAAANHNFFNTVWTTTQGPALGDDTNCPGSPNRPTPQTQQDFAVAFLSAFFDRSLRGGTRGDAYLTGELPFPGAPAKMEHLPASL